MALPKGVFSAGSKEARRRALAEKLRQAQDLSGSPISQTYQNVLPAELDPRFYNRKGDASTTLPVTQEDLGTVPAEIPSYTLSDLEGETLISSMSDRTAAGKVLTGVGQERLNYPVNLTGGQDYMFENAGDAWASAQGALTPVMNRALQVQAETGRDPILAPFTMAPTGGDFAGMTGEAMLAYTSTIAPLSTKNALNREIKNFIPDWKGVDNPDSLAQYTGAPAVVRDSIRDLMDIKFRNEGASTTAQGRIGVTDPAQIDAQVTGLRNLARIDTSRPIDPTGGNLTYPASLPGEGMGRIDTDATLADMLPEDVAGRPGATPDARFNQFRRSAELSPRVIPITDDLLRDLEGRGFKVQASPIATAAGLTVMGLTALTPEDAEASVAKLAARGYKIDRTRTSPDPDDTSSDFYVYQGDGSPTDTFVARASMKDYLDGTLRSDDTEVAAKFQRQGIATELYDAVEEMTGQPVQTSEFLTPDGAALNVARDPEGMRKKLADGYFAEGSDDNVRQALESFDSKPKLREFGEPKPEDRSVFPAPQRFFDPNDKAFKPFTAEFGPTPGGRYLTRGEGGFEDITGQFVESATLSVSPDGKPSFMVGQETAKLPPNKPGRKIKTNLFKKKAGWSWTDVPEGYDPNPAGDFPLISVEDGNKHYYTLNTQFPEGVDLARYDKSKTEPRLRPTKEKSTVTLGEKVGEISVRGKLHPVYDNAVVRFGLPAVVGAKTLAAATGGAMILGSEDAEAGGIGFGRIAGLGNKPQQVVEKISRSKPGNPQGYYNDLAQLGVKKEELDSMGFMEHFAGRNDVTKQEVVDFVNENPYQIYEDVLVDPTTTVMDYFRILDPAALKPMQELMAAGDTEGANKLFQGLRERHQVEVIESGLSDDKVPRWARKPLVLDGARANDIEYVFQYPGADAKRQLVRQELEPAVESLARVQSDMFSWSMNAAMIRNSGFQVGSGDVPEEIMDNLMTSPMLGRFAMTPEDMAARTPEQKRELVDQAIEKTMQYYDMGRAEFAAEYDPSLAPLAAELDALTREIGTGRRDGTHKPFVDITHYPDNPNPVAHMRTNEREIFDANDNYLGESLHIEEIQSDLHQVAQGKSQSTDIAPGYRDADYDARLADLREQQEKAKEVYERGSELYGEYRKGGYYTDTDGQRRYRKHSAEKQADIEEFGEQYAENKEKILQNKAQQLGGAMYKLDTAISKMEKAAPNVPMKNNWYELPIKKAIVTAVDSGADFLTLTKGRDQALRSQQINDYNSVQVNRFEDGSFEVRMLKNDMPVGVKEVKAGQPIDKALTRILGRENAEKLMTDPLTDELYESTDAFGGFSGPLTGETGSEGMVQWYDKTYVPKINKMLKRYGAKVEEVHLEDGTTVHGVRLTDEVREAIQNDKGAFTTFMRPETVVGAGAVAAGTMAPGETVQADDFESPLEQSRTIDSAISLRAQRLRENQAAEQPVDPSPLRQVNDMTDGEMTNFLSSLDDTKKVPLSERLRRTGIASADVAAEVVEDTVRVFVGAVGSAVYPYRDGQGKSLLDKALEDEGIFGGTPESKNFKKNIGDFYDKYLKEEVNQAAETIYKEKLPGQFMTLEDQVNLVADLYKSSPDFFREEIGNRIGYAALAVLSVLGIKGAKKMTNRPGTELSAPEGLTRMGAGGPPRIDDFEYIDLGGDGTLLIPRKR